MTSTAATKGDLRQTLLSESQECTLARSQYSLASTAFESAIQDQRLPTQNFGKEFGGVRSSLARSRGLRRGRRVRRSIGRIIGRLVSREFGFDVHIRIGVMVVTARVATSPAPASVPSVMTRSGLIANAFANAFGFFDEIIEEPADVVRHVIDDGEDLFEHISNQIRSGHSKIFGEVPNFLGELFRDPRVENAFFASMVTATLAAGRPTRIGCVCFHGSHCDTL